MFRTIGIFSAKRIKISWWWLGVKIGVVTALVIWWWLENQNKKLLQELTSKRKLGEGISIPLPEEGTLESRAVESGISETKSGTPSEPEDLTKIEGIGPKTNTVLQAADIQTFAELATCKPAAIKQILLDGGIRIGYPDTWPEQAALAAKGDWDGLEALQKGLQGGRRVRS